MGSRRWHVEQSDLPGLLVGRACAAPGVLFSDTELALDACALLSSLRHEGEVSLAVGLGLVVLSAERLEVRVAVVVAGLDVVHVGGWLGAATSRGLGLAPMAVSLENPLADALPVPWETRSSIRRGPRQGPHSLLGQRPAQTELLDLASDART